jgi:hypothetical protein
MLDRTTVLLPSRGGSPSARIALPVIVLAGLR